jgi:hypothetical protein
MSTEAKLVTPGFIALILLYFFYSRSKVKISSLCFSGLKMMMIEVRDCE